MVDCIWKAAVCSISCLRVPASLRILFEPTRTTSGRRSAASGFPIRSRKREYRCIRSRIIGQAPVGCYSCHVACYTCHLGVVRGQCLIMWDRRSLLRAIEVPHRSWRDDFGCETMVDGNDQQSQPCATSLAVDKIPAHLIGQRAKMPSWTLLSIPCIRPICNSHGIRLLLGAVSRAPSVQTATGSPGSSAT